MTNMLYSLEAEQAVLGALMVDNHQWDNIAALIQEDNFYLSAHKAIFCAIKSLLQANKGADLITVERVLKEKNIFDEVGGFSYLADLISHTPNIANLLEYTQIVVNDSKARQLHWLGKHLQTETSKMQSAENIHQLINYVEQQLTNLSFNHLHGEDSSTLEHVIAKLSEQMLSTCASDSWAGLSFGLEELDKCTTGAQKGDLIILAARPAMGKTALSLKFVQTALDSSDKPIQYYSLEMPAEQLLQRLLAMKCKIPLPKLRQPQYLTDPEWKDVEQALKDIHHHWQNRLIIDDCGILTPQKLLSKVRRNCRLYGMPAAIFIDYIQLMSDPMIKENGSRNLEIASISRKLKQLAKEINCPVIALSQLNRNVEQRENKRPICSDLRDSGSLEQDADLLLFIYRDEIYHAHSHFKGIAEIIIGKQRNGPIGTLFSAFQADYSLFQNLSEDQYQRLSNGDDA